ncbi:hypothetical protein ACFZCT_19675 [Streptomyces qaidamensis]|uniref:hypothetical protein n=1 Tax=Streptomyces qaidamensis TaxID=1783515 RepID=UPI0036E49F4F
MGAVGRACRTDTAGPDEAVALATEPTGDAEAARTAAALFDGVHGVDGPWRPIRPLLLTSDDYRRTADLSARAARLVLDAALRRARTAGELLAALGSRPEAFPLLDHDAPLDGHLLAAIRPDILMEHGTPRFVELNVDSALGGVLQADLVPDRFLRHYRRTPLPGGPALTAPPSAVEARAEALRSFLALPAGAAVLLPHYRVGNLPGLAEDPARFAVWLAPVFRSARRHGIELFSHPLEDLTTGRDGRLRAGGRPVDGVFRSFVSHGQGTSPGLAALARAVSTGAVGMFTPEATMLLTNKKTLAWLWEDLDRLPPREREFVTAHIPRTVRLEATAGRAAPREALTGRSRLVLKPADGFGGRGVVIGAAVSDATWHAEVERAARRGGHVLQEHVEPDRVRLGFVHTPSGEVTHAEVPYVLGPFLYGLRASGVLVRHGTPSAGPVLNAGAGVVMNSVLLVGA